MPMAAGPRGYRENACNRTSYSAIPGSSSGAIREEGRQRLKGRTAHRSETRADRFILEPSIYPPRSRDFSNERVDKGPAIMLSSFRTNEEHEHAR
jgi:hypothetical protein